MSGEINTKQLIDYVKEELTDLKEQNIISPGMFEKKNNFRLIMRAINQADRDICLFEKYEDNVAIFVPSGRTTVFFKDQKAHVKEYFDEHSTLKTEDARQYAYLLDENAFLDIISVADSVAYVFDSIPLKGEKTFTTIDKGTLNDVYAAQKRYFEPDKNVTTGGYNDNVQTYFTVHPSERKMLLSQPFDSDKWILFNAKIAPQELNVLDMEKSSLECYNIRSPYYTKAWLTLKALTELLPRTTAKEAGLAEDEILQQRRTRSLKPGTGNEVISGDEYTSAYEDEFNDL